MGRKSRVAAFLAITSMLGFLAIFAFLAFGKIATPNKDYFNMALVALIGFVGTAFGYYLGAADGQNQPQPPQGNPSPIKNDKGWAAGILLPWVVVFMMALAGMSGCIQKVVVLPVSASAEFHAEKQASNSNQLQDFRARLKEKLAEVRAEFEEEYRPR